MTRDELKQETIERIDLQGRLQKARKSGFICPHCGSGRGENGTGAVKYYKDTKKAYCEKCGKFVDIFDLYAADHPGLQFGEVLDALAKEAGLDPSAAASSSGGKPKQEQPKQQEEPEQDFSEYYKAAHAALIQTDYLKRRGISQEVADKFMIGFDPAYQGKSTGGQIWEALIIPTSKSSYVIRNTDPYADKDHRYRKFGNARIYREKEILRHADGVIFVVEGELDALAIYTAGGYAIGLGSTSNVKQLLTYLKNEKPDQAFAVCLDNDEAGEKAAAELEKGLQELGLSTYRPDLYGNCKDAGEAITTDPEALRQRIKEVKDNIKAEIREAQEAKNEAYLAETRASNYLQEFLNGIAASANTPCIPTGFKHLDDLLDGGLYEGLYTVGAISSLGKTTLIMQICDQIAASGAADCLIFSLEMARAELISKSISRITLMKVLEEKRDQSLAKTARGITDGKRWAKYSDEEQKLILASANVYQRYADRLYISEGIGDISVAQIREKVQRHIFATGGRLERDEISGKERYICAAGHRPVIVIDYLQILAPADIRATDKQNMDRNVLALKQLSRDYKIPVIVISSFNRENYTAKVNMAAFKESGAIEYSSDVVIGLQLKGAGDGKSFDEDAAIKKDPREIEAKILKNRGGKTRESVIFNYYPMFNYYKEQ